MNIAISKRVRLGTERVAVGEDVSPATDCVRDRVPVGWSEIAVWRKSCRQRLIRQRLAKPAKERDASSATIAAQLNAVIGRLEGRTIGLYWPFKGEPNLYPWTRKAIEAGAIIALPVVIEKNCPLEFRQWRPGDPLERGVWNIPVPSHGPAVYPDVLVAPLVGFDGDHYRLGYGGGFYDRTIAASPNHPFLVGVGYADSQLATIHPQPHDIAMDVIVSDA